MFLIPWVDHRKKVFGVEEYFSAYLKYWNKKKILLLQPKFYFHKMSASQKFQVDRSSHFGAIFLNDFNLDTTF